MTVAWSVGLTRAGSLGGLQEGLRSCPIIEGSMLQKWGGVGAADPFAIQVEGIWFVFFEMLTHSANAVIGVASSPDLEEWNVLGVCLREPHHLSYPFVFRHGDDIFMVPESKSVRRVDAYRAIDFPMRWERCATLARGRLMDATLVPWQGKYWMLSGWHSYWLRAFWSHHPMGPYRPHWLPVVRTYRKGNVRPGGRIVSVGGQLIRPVQDNTECYGKQLRAMVIERLDRGWFSERPFQASPLLQPSGKTWYSQRMHHADLHRVENGWLGFVDGCI
ncbi:MAG: hypothetical protein ACK553_00010 [Planctomycetota bacterium]|jgi:hypothetical protein